MNASSGVVHHVCAMRHARNMGELRDATLVGWVSRPSTPRQITHIWKKKGNPCPMRTSAQSRTQGDPVSPEEPVGQQGGQAGRGVHINLGCPSHGGRSFGCAGAQPTALAPR